MNCAWVQTFLIKCQLCIYYFYFQRKTFTCGTNSSKTLYFLFICLMAPILWGNKTLLFSSHRYGLKVYIIVIEWFIEATSAQESLIIFSWLVPLVSNTNYQLHWSTWMAMLHPNSIPILSPILYSWFWSKANWLVPAIWHLILLLQRLHFWRSRGSRVSSKGVAPRLCHLYINHPAIKVLKKRSHESLKFIKQMYCHVVGKSLSLIYLKNKREVAKQNLVIHIF